MTITILTHDPRWKGLGPTVRRAGEAVVSALRPGGLLSSSPLKRGAIAQAPRVSFTILLTTDAELRTLNHAYRAKDKPTNVLSFPDGSAINGVTQLGDIALAYETIAREAGEQGKTLKHHLTHLTIHGVLHLMGYDHEVAQEAQVMEALEIQLLASMGIANPYEAD